MSTKALFLIFNCPYKVIKLSKSFLSSLKSITFYYSLLHPTTAGFGTVKKLIHNGVTQSQVNTAGVEQVLRASN